MGLNGERIISLRRHISWDFIPSDMLENLELKNKKQNRFSSVR